MLPIKSSSDDDAGFRHGFGAEALLPLTPGAPAISLNTIRLYWLMFALYGCHIHSYAVTVLFWFFSFLYIPSSLLVKVRVKNVEVEFEIKPQHPISRGNMSVDQPFLTHCCCRFSYFPIYADVPSWCWPRKGSLIQQW